MHLLFSHRQILIELLDNLPSFTPQNLYDHFVNEGSADAYTWYMRLLTAGDLQKVYIFNS